MRQSILLLSVALVFCSATARSQPASPPTARPTTQPTTTDQKLPANYVPSGRVLYQFYCATCHGPDAKGNGPMALALKTPPADLTTLAKRHDGKFPADYVTRLLQFGGSSRTHGSADMPAWGPIFQYFDKASRLAAQKRIDNLRNYLASIQQ
jgi:mono/diheme cytochrome c family protein